MRAWGDPWYVFGAQACVAYGVARLTADVDVTAAVPETDLPRFVRAMEEAGFAPRVPDPAAFAREARVLPFTHAPTGIPVDLVLLGTPLEEQILSRIRRLDLGGAAVPFIGPEDLVAVKILAGRPKDLGDAQALLTRHAGSVDVAAVRALLAAFERALDRADLVAELDRLLRGAGSPS
jgi:hypothetical protein